MSFDLKTWDGFSELTKDQADFLLDTTAINKRLADQRNSPNRWREGSFAMPIGGSQDTRERMVKGACDRFVQSMERQGWTLRSKLQVFKAGQRRQAGHSYAVDLDSGALLLDKEEWCIRAVFSTNPKPVRLELPVVKEDYPGERVSLEDTVRHMGTKAVSRKEREAATPRA
jgi:hypothetical protein